MLFVYSLSSAQTKSSLYINVEDCRTKKHGYVPPNFSLYKDNVLIRKVNPQNQNSRMFTDLEYGEYQLEYYTLFGYDTLTINISENNNHQIIDLCVDYLDYETQNHKPIIDKLKNEESYSILVESSGCFHNREEKMIITKKGNNYYLKYKKRKKKLKEKEITAIRHFEIEMTTIPQIYFCTTVDGYTLKYNNEETVFIDRGCEWKGFYYLKKKLNLK